MRTILQFHLLSLLGMIISLPAPLQAEEGIIRLEVFSMTKPTAAKLLADERLLKDPAAVVAEIKQMQSRNEAKLVATPALRGTYPFRTKVDGDVIVEVDAGLGADKSRSNLNIFVGAGKPGNASSIATALPVRRGKPKFLGTLEPAAIDRVNTWMVFVYAD